MKVFLDTNVFIYSARSEHPPRAPSVNVLKDVSEGALDAVTNAEVVQEILYVLSRRNRQSARVLLFGCSRTYWLQWDDG